MYRIYLKINVIAQNRQHGLCFKHFILYFNTLYCMKKSIFVFLILTVAVRLPAAISNDSLVIISDLLFKNANEKNAFLEYQTSKTNADLIDLFLTPFDRNDGYDSKIAHQKIRECVEVIKKETKGLTDAKRVKFIYKHVHQSFLKIYKLNNSFSDIFEKGEYNCVSASALYAIILKELDIPCQIVEAPQHVFIIAYPQTDKILIETTSPEKGYFIFNDTYVEKYIKYLMESKLISKEEYENTSANTLFNKYYYSTAGVSITELAGLQYTNYSIYDSEAGNYDRAIQQVKKGYYLNTSERNRYLLKSILSYQLNNNDYSDPKQVYNFKVLCRFNNLKDKLISNEAIQNEFIRIMQAQLIKNSNYAEFEKSFKITYDVLTDTTLKKDIAFDYHYELARLGYNNLQTKDYEMKHLCAAYAINPKQANLQNIILGYFSRLIEKNNEPNNIITLMKEFLEKFDFLNNNNQFNVVRCNCILELAYQSLYLSDITKGEAHLAEFESICSKNKEITPSSYYVEKAYSAAASYYYKKGNKAKCKQFLKTGLNYAPDNFGLKQRLSQVN